MKPTATGKATGLLDDMSIHHMPGQLMRRLRQLAKRLFAEEIVGPFDPYQRRHIRCGTRIMLGCARWAASAMRRASSGRYNELWHSRTPERFVGEFEGLYSWKVDHCLAD